MTEAEWLRCTDPNPMLAVYWDTSVCANRSATCSAGDARAMLCGKLRIAKYGCWCLGSA